MTEVTISSLKAHLQTASREDLYEFSGRTRNSPFHMEIQLGHSGMEYDKGAFVEKLWGRLKEQGMLSDATGHVATKVVDAYCRVFGETVTSLEAGSVADLLRGRT